MKPNELDQIIRDTLSEEDAALYDKLSDPSIPDIVTDLFMGRQRSLRAIGFVISLGFVGAAFWMGMRLLEATETRWLVIWATGFLSCISAIFSLKVWYWLEMSRSASTREIKRLELQVARLAEAVRGDG
jgi:hypothetical protein